MDEPDEGARGKAKHCQNADEPRLGVDFSALIVQDTRVFKAGNSLAIRIPSSVAKRIALEDGTAVEIAIDDGLLYIRKTPSRSLADLIEKITPENVHRPIFDDIIGAKHW